MQTNSKVRKKILRVELYENIRRSVNFEGLSIRGAAFQFKVHRREVRNALASAIPPERKVVPKRRPKLGQYEATVRKWLVEDADLPRKQRHTAARIWGRLIDECGADVSPSAVRVMVKELRAEIAPVVPIAMVPQIHAPGESADVDYGDVYVEIAGELVKAKMFAIRLSCSGKAFHMVYASEAQECFFDGHEKAFEAFGGVPGTIRYDNLSSAVQKVLIARERVENERFVAFRSHWEFISSFCTPGIEGAHEKGGIEGEIKRARRSYFVPVLRGATMAEITDQALATCAIAQLRFNLRNSFFTLALEEYNELVADYNSNELTDLRPLYQALAKCTVALEVSFSDITDYEAALEILRAASPAGEHMYPELMESLVDVAENREIIATEIAESTTWLLNVVESRK